MIFIGIFAIVFLFCFFYWVKNKDGWVFLLMIPTTVMCALFLTVLPSTKTPIENHPIEIVSVNQNRAQTMSGGGNFLGWSISSKQELQYVVMLKYEDGRMKKLCLNQEETYVVESDDAPRVEFPQERYTYSKWIHWPTLWEDSKDWYSYKNATIFVPKGTVAVKFGEI